MKYFLKLASDRASAAREESEQAVLQEVEDLDVIMTPEKSVIFRVICWLNDSASSLWCLVCC